jgi:hypothetical protein
VKFRIRIPSLTKKLAARLSWRRFIRHNLGFKAPRGWGWLTDPRRALHNRIYNRTTMGCSGMLLLLLGGMVLSLMLTQAAVRFTAMLIH